MSEQIKQFFGGPPLSVAVRLVLLSILVGVILSALGLDPLNLWRSLQNLRAGDPDLADHATGKKHKRADV